MGAGKSKPKKSSFRPKTRRASNPKKYIKPPHRPMTARASAKKTVTVRRNVSIRKAPVKAGSPRSAMNKVWKTQLLVDAGTRKLLIAAAGEHSLHVIGEFTAEMSDEEIAKKTKIRSSDVRVVLNKLHSYGLASYTRSRDKNSGWYSYVWRLNNEHASALVEKMREQMAAGEQTHLQPSAAGSVEEYYCRNCGPDTRLPFEDASAGLFKCGQCGSSLEFFDKNAPKPPATD